MTIAAVREAVRGEALIGLTGAEGMSTYFPDWGTFGFQPSAARASVAARRTL